MKKLIILLIIGAIGWKAYGKYQQRVEASFIEDEPTAEVQRERPVTRVAPPKPSGEVLQTLGSYQCDGRLHCNQMTSCEEANWFLKNCPGVKMDGDMDGLPCERGPC